MVRSLLKDERGYSLIEVVVSIMILAIAILPMAGMFDMGLKSATVGSHYDKARALANLKLEEAKDLPFADVENNFPQAGTTTPYDGSDWLPGPDPDFTDYFQYRVEKDYMGESDPANQDASRNFGPSGAPTGLIRLSVEVRWGEDNDGNGLPDKSFTTTGLVAQ